MAVQFKFFHIPISTYEESEAQLNRFLRSVKVLQTHMEFVEQGSNSFWNFAIEYYLDGQEDQRRKSLKTGRNRADYKEILSPEDFSLFVKLRDWRKNVAAQESVPLYAILNNEQLAIIAEKRIATISGLQSIEGIGESRVKKYAEKIIKIVSEVNNSVQEIK